MTDNTGRAEALLAEHREGRGRLKVFLGAAPGVGKTYAMLQAAQTALRQGRRVRAGIVETHGRRETAALLAGLPQQPLRRVEHRGLKLTELDLEGLLADPDAALAGLPTFKDGGAATVARLPWQGQDLVLKRYNIKGFGHWLTRFWRPSRAWHSWREGHRLLFLGIPTPEPLAVRERRFLGLRGRAYLVTPFVDGPNLLERFAPYVDSAPPAAELDALLALVEALRRERLGHGDFKGTNLIWHDGRWLVIDLDALQAHDSDRAYAGAYARDRARLLRNWPADSALHRLLDERLPLA